MIQTAFEQGLDIVADLVKRFSRNAATYRSAEYNETRARIEFINRFFEALDWDVNNREGVAPQYQEVLHEYSEEIEGARKAPDYAFRTGSREPKFFVEAKKPGVNIKNSAEAAYQLRRYAWSARLPLSILTDFEELAVYDCRVRPASTDKASVGRVQLYTYQSYPDRWREIWDVFSRQAVRNGSFDRFAQGEKGRRGTSPVDAEFLKEIEGWRDALARNMALRNPRLSVDELNDAVQRTIDRIIFLRMAEDRGVEPYEQLRRLAQPSEGSKPSEGSSYADLIDLCRRADAKYNSGLFDLRADTLTPRLLVDDKALKPILADLYFPRSPYEFSVLPPEILGNVYEQFLGKVIRLTAAHQAKVEEKPEVKKAGGVYYTPSYIVDYIVKNTVGKWIETHRPEGSARPFGSLRILDPACGSGSFLLGAYQYLLDYYLNWYGTHPESWARAKTPPIYQATGRAARSEIQNPKSEIEWRLTTAEKKRILTTHIFGVDIDRQAVEVTKLSLLLKVLEGESDETLGQQLALFQERALPNLDDNIKCGNSLIGPDYFAGQFIPDPDELRRVNPFDWEREFPQVFSLSPTLPRAAGEGREGAGFDCVIGNPPWGGDIDKRLDYLHATYPATTQEHTDTFKLFIEKGVRLTRTGGLVSMIVPNTLLRQRRLKDVRALVLQTEILTLVDLGEDVFKGVVAPSCVFVLRRKKPTNEHKVCILNLSQLSNTTKAESLRGESRVGSFAEQRLFQFNIDLEFVAVPIKFNVLVTPLSEFDTLECKDAGINYQRVNVGMRAKGKSDLADRLLYEGKRQKDRDKMYWKGSDIDRYWIAETTERWCRPNYPEFVRANEVVHLNEQVYNTTPKILFRQTADRIIATIDYRGVWFGRSVIAIVPTRQSDYRIEYFLGLFNSRYFEWLYSQLVQETGRVFAQVKLAKVKQLPIRPINFSDPADVACHDRMVALVEQMLELRKRLAAASERDRELYQRQIDATDREIDRLVYNLYGLTEEEIKIVEETAR